MKSYSTIIKNTFKLILMMCMNVEPMIQSEASQIEKKTNYHILMYIYMDSRKMVPMNLFASGKEPAS